MISRFDKKLGDMVLIPADVCLFRKNSNGYIQVSTTTTKPQEAILLEEDSGESHKIFLDGEYWLVLDEDIYGN